MDYGCQATFTGAFAMMEQYDHALCYHDATNLVFLLVVSSKFRKTPIAATRLVEMEMDNTSYCWSCIDLGHTKKDCPSKQKKAPTVEKPKQKTFVSAKDSAKEDIKLLPK